MNIELLLLALASNAPPAAAWAPSSGRTQRHRQQFSSTARFIGQGWDNEDFLGSLSGSDADRDRANSDYYAKSRYNRMDSDAAADVPAVPGSDELPADGGMTKGAVITEEMKQRIKEQNEKDQSQGGRMFKELLAKAQQRQQQAQSFPAVGPNHLPSLMTVQPYQPPPVGPPPTAGLSPESLASLTVEQQAELFRQMVAGGGNPLSGAGPPAYPNTNMYAAPQAYPPQGAPVAPDGRRVGRNRDADQIQNSADLYFAQLKRDSAIRKQAWLAGDAEKANAVFADPSIKEIEERISPFLEERKKLDRSVLDTSEDEMILPEMLGAAAPSTSAAAAKPKDYSGISYKEKMRQMQEKKMKRTGGVSEGARSSDSTAAESAPATASSGSAASTPATEPTATTSAARETVAPSISKPPQQGSAAATVAPASTSTPPATVTGPSEDDKRSDIRTLMGLLLKHRGGPGFGAGRLKGDEVNLFENLSNVLVQVLKEEGVSVSSAVAATEAASLTMGQGAGGATTDKVNSLISVLEGAITMYNNSPPDLKQSVIGILRAALTTAISSLDEIVGSSQDNSAATASIPGESSEGRVQSMIRCIEAACQVYKNSPPELQQPVLVTLRAAFQSAVKTLDGIVADGQGQTQVASVAATTDATATEVTPAVQSYSGNDENTKFFEDVYKKLQSAAGDDKLGLKKDMNVDDAADLADSIAEMRTKLVDELENGIPE